MAYLVFRIVLTLSMVEASEIIPMEQAVSLIRHSDVLTDWPLVHNALIHDGKILDKFVTKRVVIPVCQLVTIYKDAARSEAMVRAAIEHGLQETLRGKLDDPVLQEKIYQLISKELWESLEKALKDREKEKTFFERILSINVANKLSFGQSIATEVKGSCALVQVEGGTWVRSQNAWVRSDSIVFQIDLDAKMIAFDCKALEQLEKSDNLKANASQDPLDFLLGDDEL